MRCCTHAHCCIIKRWRATGFKPQMVIIEPTVDNNAVWPRPVVRIILGVGRSRYSEPSWTCGCGKFVGFSRRVAEESVEAHGGRVYSSIVVSWMAHHTTARGGGGSSTLSCAMLATVRLRAAEQWAASGSEQRAALSAQFSMLTVVLLFIVFSSAAVCLSVRLIPKNWEFSTINLDCLLLNLCSAIWQWKTSRKTAYEQISFK